VSMQRRNTCCSQGGGDLFELELVGRGLYRPVVGGDRRVAWEGGCADRGYAKG